MFLFLFLFRQENTGHQTKSHPWLGFLFLAGPILQRRALPLSLIFLTLKRPGLPECGAVNLMLFECLRNLHSYKYRVKFTDLADAPRDNMASSLHVHKEVSH